MGDAGSGEQQVEALLALGLAEDRARRAVAEDRVALVLLEEVIHGGRVHPPEKVAEEAGVAVELLRTWESALGVPSHDRYRDSDIESAKLLGEMLSVLPGLDIDRVLRSLRADAQMLRRMALGDLQVVYEQFIQPVREQEGDKVLVALAAAEAARTLIPIAGPLVGVAYKRVLEHLLSTELVAQATRGTTDTLQLAVGFVDVVGYTSLSARVDPSGLDDVIEAFETRCYAVAGTSEQVQLVKFLGDAGMFVAVDPVVLAEALLELIQPVDADSALDDAPMRGGMAAGEVLVRMGDYFGPPVNLAARLTDRARTARLLVAEDLGDVLGERFPLRLAPSMKLRDLGRHRPYSLRPARDEDGD
jgi:adenylate cyclase